MTTDDLPPFESEDVEDWVSFAVALQSLVHSDHISPEERLAAIHESLVRAVGGNGRAGMQSATDFVDQVTLGLLKP